MGWWSTGIMAGDSPLDWEDEFYSLCGVQKWPEDSDKMAKLPKDKLGANLPKIIGVIERESGWEQQIAYQVLGVKMLSSGCPIEESLKEKMIQSLEEDHWAKTDEERRKDCLDLIAKLKAHQDTPTEVESKGLFEVFGEAIASGLEAGQLINKIPPRHE